MKDFPKTLAVKQDYLNLLNIPEFKEKTLKLLKKLYLIEDDKVTICNNIENNKTAIIDNPSPMWKIKGFDSKEEIKKLIIDNGGIF